MTTDQPTAIKTNRRWHQYSLRTLLIFVTLFALACSWFTVKMQQAKRQREVVESLIKSGSFVAYDYEMNSKVWIKLLNQKIPGPEWIRKMLGDDFFRTVTYVNLSNMQRSFDKGNGFVIEVPAIRSNLLVTADMLKQLEELKQLEVIRLDHTNISDDGLKYLKNFNHLHVLSLEGTHITDAGLEHLKDFEELYNLNLNRTDITDDGLKHLKGLLKLQMLDILDTKTTDTGIKDIQQALPKLKIFR
jgi:hypothetical protein